MNNKIIAPNETLELNELITFKDTCLTKSFTMSSLVSDDELKTILQNDVATGEQHIKSLRRLLEKSHVDD